MPSKRTPVVAAQALDRALATSAANGFELLIEDLQPLLPFVTWDSIYPVETVGPEFERNCSFTEIIGKNAPVVAGGFSAGLTLMAEDFLYPWHHHPASEVYLIMTPGSLWALNNGPFDAKTPGAVVYHASKAPHAMRTSDHPMLAPWIWFGDIDEKPKMSAGRGSR